MRVEPDVAPVHEPEQGGEPLRYVQVVVEGPAEGGDRFLRGLRKPGLRPIHPDRVGAKAPIEVEEAPHGPARGLEPVPGEVELRPVVGREEVVADRRGGHALAEERADGHDVPERLGHLPSLHPEVFRVDPVAGEGLPRGSLGLRDLVFVVREDEILPAEMEVERPADLRERHRGALEVPTGPALPPGCVPRRPGPPGPPPSPPSRGRSPARPPFRSRRR